MCRRWQVSGCHLLLSVCLPSAAHLLQGSSLGPARGGVHHSDCIWLEFTVEPQSNVSQHTSLMQNQAVNHKCQLIPVSTSQKILHTSFHRRHRAAHRTVPQPEAATCFSLFYKNPNTNDLRQEEEETDHTGARRRDTVSGLIHAIKGLFPHPRPPPN